MVVKNIKYIRVDQGIYISQKKDMFPILLSSVCAQHVQACPAKRQRLSRRVQRSSMDGLKGGAERCGHRRKRRSGEEEEDEEEGEGEEEETTP